MPQKVLPNASDIADFQERIAAVGYRQITQPEFANFFQALGLRAPRIRKGREIGFTFSANGLTAIVWTTFLDTEDQAREEDAGWVLILERGKIKYSSHPMMRTSGFLEKLFMQAKIARERVAKRPLCPSCYGYMDIERGNGMKSRYWICRSAEHKEYTEQFPWDFGLCQESLRFVKLERRIRGRYYRKLKKEGRKIGQAMLSRRLWK